jgi:hypothetical protein
LEIIYVIAKKGHVSVVATLLQHGADKSIHCVANQPALEHAAVVALLA